MQIARFRESIALIYASTSSRITAPLRSVGRPLWHKRAATAPLRSIKRLIARLLYSPPGYPLRIGWQALKHFSRKKDAGLRSPVKPNPLVSVLIVNYNGEHHLNHLFASLACLTYKNYEIIMIDNASTDASVEFVKSNYPKVKILQLKDNVGFAEANNIGFELSRGDYLFLLNNDTRCDPACLSHLVEALDNDPGLGGAGPKILFWIKFITVEIMVPSSVSALLDVDCLRKVSPEYPKFFFQQGFSEPFIHNGKEVRRFFGKAKFSIPADSMRSSIPLHICAETKSTTATVRIGSEKSVHPLEGGAWQLTRVAASQSAIEPYWIVNNAGSQVTQEGDVSDRGFGHPDDRIFDIGDEVSALCGCAMLVRRSVLRDKPLFAKNFFAYFEDTDLSLRIRRSGYRLAYCPKSIVYHKHASTRGENSAFFKYYVNRNKILFYALHFPKPFWQQALAKARLDLNHLKTYYANSGTQEERNFGQQIDGIFADWGRLLPQIAEDRFYDRTPHFPLLAVYNNFWNSKGGGEYRAAVIAELLQTLGPVDLICEQDFSIEEITEQFCVDLSGCRKVITSPTELHHKRDFTRRYDIFVNSTYGSDLVSHAKHSLYLVSFPFRLEGRGARASRFLSSYRVFLANSNYTKIWCQRYWGVDAETLYPSVRDEGTVVGDESKKKIILNVGRFFWHGHNKKQRELVQIFKELVSERALDPEWKLVLAGQVERGHEDYFDTVRKAAQGLPIELHPNISCGELSRLYGQAAIYWHATGLGEDLDRYPDRAEHFGITTVEAMAFGCVPIVLRAGGQPEIVEEGINGYLFADINGLKRKTQLVARMLDCDLNSAFIATSAKARVRAKEFSKARTQERFLMLLASAKSNQQATQVNPPVERHDSDRGRQARVVG